MISYAKNFHKQTLMDIWKIAFPDDSDAFVNFYFEKKYRKENTLLLFKNEKIASCLQMLPYKMTYYKNVINTSYISGAATLPAYQNQGLMKNLLSHAFAEMRKRGDTLTTLIPQEAWLIDFYKKMGYAPCFDYGLVPVDTDAYPVFHNKMQFREFEPADLYSAFLLHKEYFERKNVCIQKSIFDFSTMVQACRKFDGKVYVLIDREKIVALGFCFFDNGRLIIKDRVTANKNYRHYFLSKLIQKFDNQPIFIYSSSNNPTLTQSLGMARIIDAKKMLWRFAKTYPRVAFLIKIHDEQVSENNLSLVVAHGKIAETESQTFDFEVSIAKLTRLLLGYQTESLGEKYAVFPQQYPYMSLMLE